MLQNLVLNSVRWAGSCLLSGGILWQVASMAGPTSGEVVVHVVEEDATVTIDDLSYPTDRPTGSMIVCNLPVGTHTLRTYRGEELIQREDFKIAPGEDVVLTAHDLSAYEGKQAPSFDPRR